MKIISFKSINMPTFVMRTVLVLTVASILAEVVFHIPDAWHRDGTPVRMLVESLLIIITFTPLLWWYVLKPLCQESEELSHKNEEHLLSIMETTLEATADGIVVLDTAKNVVLYNKKYLDMWGKEGHVFISEKDALQIFERLKHLLKEPEIFLQKSLDCYNNTEKSFKDEVLFKDGRVYERYTQPQKLKDKTVGWVSSYHEITDKRLSEKALRESEERFRQIVEQSDDAMFLCSSEGIVIDFNTAAEKLFGCKKSDFISKPLKNLFDDENYKLICHQIDSKDIDSQSGFSPIKLNTLDNRTLQISMNVKEINLTGEVVLLLVMCDVTEKNRLDSYTKEIQAKLIQANKMSSLGLLVSGIAHEINNPNNYIMISSELVSRVWKDCLPILEEHFEEHGDFQVGGVPFSSFEPESMELFDGITEGSRRIRDIVNSLKDFSRHNIGIYEQSLDINNVVKSATTIIAHHIKRMTHRFNLQLGETLPPIRGNKHQLEQVVINLILNALQSLPSPDGSVSVTTGYDASKQEIFLTVTDQGRGIPDDVKTRIMEPFFTTRLDSGGTGLGLSICKTIVNDHEGTISFISEKAEGTAFTLRFPLRGFSQ